MILELNGLDVDCIIGERPEERERPQRLTLDVQLEIDDVAATSDELSDTVDYASLAGRIRTALVEAQCRLIERAAKVVYDVCQANGKVRAARVKVTKAGAVPHLTSASAICSANIA